MRRADRQRAAPVALLLFGQALDALHFLEDLQSPIDHPLTGRRDARQGASLAQKDRKSQFVLELLELLADAGLRGVQALGGGGDVQIVFDDRRQIA